MSALVQVAPEAWTREEAVLEAGAHHLLQVAILEIVGEDGAHIFVGEVDAGDAFIVGRERYRYSVFHVDR